MYKIPYVFVALSVVLQSSPSVNAEDAMPSIEMLVETYQVAVRESPQLEITFRLGGLPRGLRVSQIDAKSRDELRTLSKARVLSEVIVEDASIRGELTECLAQLNSLKSLTFRNCSFGEETSYLKKIAKGCPRLESLEFGRCFVARQVLRHMPQFPSVQKLTFDDTFIADGVMRFDERFPSLQKLWLIRSGSGDRDALSLSKLRELEVVEFSESDLTLIGLSAMVKQPKLHTVLAWLVAISDEEAKGLLAMYPDKLIEVFPEENYFLR
jgi:hypothetical protein